jgi:hypothetical protein
VERQRAQEEEQAQKERQAGMQAWIASLQDKTREELIAQQRAETPHWSDDELGPWADSKLRLSPHVLNRSQCSTGRLAVPSTRDYLPCIAHNRATPQEEQSLQKRARQNYKPSFLTCASLTSQEAGHSIRRDQLAPYMDVVRGFLGEWVASSPRSQ